ncbi:type III-A CRISPR-associated protein Csm2 [Hydrogenimonas cancrithermarum]|uniref:CRISPR system Cms protein Csm2 n=1 Tax=Hydrogenimonas cancrithermarum TaxID=2993563 RepID=A0ABM8FI51_9BACT|nr:type III-A CRISPR-associated protein Csm2 [Hydrogenimonas cancrithermarum]BDY11958.1 hypothetical protein HCR_02700 [Hydrogenimonas cancrithermarum]
MKQIILDYKKDPELFNETAREWATKICGRNDKCEVKSTQLRNFYDKVLELYDRSEIKKEPFEEVLPFVKMLNSKVEYASHRKSEGKPLINKAFAEMMGQCISQVDSPEKLRVFKLFFEAVIGFYKGK